MGNPEFGTSRVDAQSSEAVARSDRVRNQAGARREPELVDVEACLLLRLPHPIKARRAHAMISGRFRRCSLVSSLLLRSKCNGEAQEVNGPKTAIKAGRYRGVRDDYASGCLPSVRGLVAPSLTLAEGPPAPPTRQQAPARRREITRGFSGLDRRLAHFYPTSRATAAVNSPCGCTVSLPKCAGSQDGSDGLTYCLQHQFRPQANP
jgi:hypothetical protein